jgi:hypothetical protein
MANRQPVDKGTAERLLSGATRPDDAPPGFAGVARLIDMASTMPTAEQSPAEAALVATMAEAIRSQPTPHPIAPQRKTVLAKLLSAKIAAAAAAIALTATGAAAATGSLPDAAQNGVAKAASHIGVNLPASANDHARDATTKPTGADNSTAGEDHAGTNDDHGTAVSDTARNTDATGADKGEAVSTVARNGHGSQSANHPTGPPAENPAPVATPNAGGTGTADQASNGASTVGTDHAADQSSQGSANAENHPTPENHPGRP